MFGDLCFSNIANSLNQYQYCLLKLNFFLVSFLELYFPTVLLLKYNAQNTVEYHDYQYIFFASSILDAEDACKETPLFPQKEIELNMIKISGNMEIQMLCLQMYKREST